MRTITRLVGAAAAVLFLAGPASAIDMCFQSDQYLFVARSYKRPSPGKCRPLTGYEGSTSAPYPATGTVCLNAFGTMLYVHWSSLIGGFGDQVAYSSRTEFPYPSLTGGTTYSIAASASGNDDNIVPNKSAYPCQPAPLP